MPCRSQRHSKPAKPYDPSPPPPRKRALTTTSIAPNINKRPCSNAPPLPAQTRVAAEALQQLSRSTQREETAIEEQVYISTESEEEEEDDQGLSSLSQIPSPPLELDTFSYI
jgi:hypothetical protein